MAMSEKVILTYYHADGRAYDVKESPLVECSVCGHKADLMCIVDGMCIDCVEAELERLRNEVVQIYTHIECANPDCKRGVRPRFAICGLCPACAEDDLIRLRRIENALLNGQTHTDAAEWFRAVAREFVLRQDRAPLFAIADALEGVGDNVDG